MNCKVRDGYQYGRNLGLRALRQGYAVAIGAMRHFTITYGNSPVFWNDADCRDKRKHGTLVLVLETRLPARSSFPLLPFLLPFILLLGFFSYRGEALWCGQLDLARTPTQPKAWHLWWAFASGTHGHVPFFILFSHGNSSHISLIYGNNKNTYMTKKITSLSILVASWRIMNTWIIQCSYSVVRTPYSSTDWRPITAVCCGTIAPCCLSNTRDDVESTWDRGKSFACIYCYSPALFVNIRQTTIALPLLLCSHSNVGCRSNSSVIMQ